MPMDIISLRNFHMTAIIGPDAWNRPGRLQSILLTLKLFMDTTSAGTSDDIAHTFSYGQMCKDVTVLSHGHFRSIDDLTSSIAGIALANDWPGESLEISIVAPKALLRAEGGLVREVKFRKQWIENGAAKRQVWGLERHAWLVKELKVACIVGVNPHERLDKQQVTINLEILGEHGENQGYWTEQTTEGKGPWATLVSRVCSVSYDLSRSTCPAAAIYLPV